MASLSTVTASPGRQREPPMGSRASQAVTSSHPQLDTLVRRAVEAGHCTRQGGWLRHEEIGHIECQLSRFGACGEPAQQCPGCQKDWIQKGDPERPPGRDFTLTSDLPRVHQRHLPVAMPYRPRTTSTTGHAGAR